MSVLVSDAKCQRTAEYQLISVIYYPIDCLILQSRYVFIYIAAYSISSMIETLIANIDNIDNIDANVTVYIVVHAA